jgi:acyl-CoA thioesterase-1
MNSRSAQIETNVATRPKPHRTSKLVTAMTTLSLLAALLGCDRPAEPPPPAATVAPTGPVLVAAGDSLTAGFGVADEDNFPSQLARRLQEAGLAWQVINAGASGETSSGLLSRLEWLMTMKPAIVILETGANDGLRGVDPALTKANIREIIRYLQGRGVTTILTGMRMLENLGPAYTAAFDRIYPELARETGVLFVPFILEGVAANPALNLEDGIHPNREGYRLVVDTLYPVVTGAMAQCSQGLGKK